MPTKNRQEQPGRKTRSYKADSAKSVTIEAGESVEGSFQGEKPITITDQNTGEDKEVRLFQFTDKSGKPFVILGRTMLDQAFDNMYKAEGGYEKCLGLNIRIERGEDEKLSGKRTMGTYQLSVWED